MEAHPETSNPESQFTERRSERRRKSLVNKLVHAELRMGEVDSRLFLYLVDISLGGMRVNLDRELQPESTVELSIPVSPYLPGTTRLKATCRVAWNRKLAGGTVVHGLEFRDLSDADTVTVRSLFEAFSPEGKRDRFRLNRVLNIAFLENGRWRSWTACDLTPEGVGLQMRDPLPLDQTLPFRLFLENGEKFAPLEVIGTVNLVSETDDGLYRLGVRFEDPDEEAVRRVRAYIDRCLERE